MESIKIRLYDLKYGNNLIGLPFTSIYRVDFIDATTEGTTYTGNKGICIGDIVNAKINIKYLVPQVIFIILVLSSLMEQ